MLYYENELPIELNPQSHLEENLESTADFIYNVNKEDELNGLILNNKKSHLNQATNLNFENQKDNYAFFNDVKSDFQSNSAQSFYENMNGKIPGRIYSYKNK